MTDRSVISTLSVQSHKCGNALTLGEGVFDTDWIFSYNRYVSLWIYSYCYLTGYTPYTESSDSVFSIKPKVERQRT